MSAGESTGEISLWNNMFLWFKLWFWLSKMYVGLSAERNVESILHPPNMTD